MITTARMADKRAPRRLRPTVRRPTGPPPAALGGLNLTRTELFLCGLALMGCLALNYQPIYDRLGNYIIVLLSLVSYATPASGMFFLAAAQMIPDPPSLPLSSSEIAVLGFFLHTFLTNRWSHLHAAVPLIRAVAPFFSGSRRLCS
jgi:hypothetical protein